MTYLITAILIVFIVLVIRRHRKKKGTVRKYPFQLYRHLKESDEDLIAMLVYVERMNDDISNERLLDDYILTKTARQRVKEIAKNFRHKPESLKHKHDLKDKGLILYAENLIKGANPENMVDTWMKSEGHRKILLSPHYKYTGIAVDKIDGIWYGVQIFGR